MESPRHPSHLGALHDHRASAGRELAMRLGAYRDRDDVVVLALGRSGALIAFDIASALRVPMDVFVVRPLGAPGTPELAIGAIASRGSIVLNEDLIEYLGLTSEEVDQVRRCEERALEASERAFRGERAMLELHMKTVIVVDDGLATGVSMRVAVKALRALEPAHIIVAMPVGAHAPCADVRREVDKFVCLRAPRPFQSVALLGDSFDPISDTEVEHLLDWAARPSKH